VSRHKPWNTAYLGEVIPINYLEIKKSIFIEEERIAI
jgi:hypothetical protein